MRLHFTMYVFICMIIYVLNTISADVNTTSGLARGVDDGTNVFYLGVPYATPPVGPLRFQPPRRAEYQKLINATKYGKICMSLGPDCANCPMSEDCLFINVFTKKQITNKLPVMVFIHGGGLTEGSGMVYTKGVVRNFLNNDVILVTLNYRLGPFGFFNANSTSLPANNGNKDQLMALQWVHDNIAEFGGDPRRVTVFGQSSGASSVALLSYSPMAKGLINQIILESGSAYVNWALNSAEYRMFYNPSSNLSRSLGCSTDESWTSGDREEIRDCLVGKSVAEIMKADKDLPKYDPIMGANWFPYVDGKGGFLPDLPERLNSQRTDMNMLMGNTHDEFAFNPNSVDLSHYNGTANFYSTLNAICTEKAFGLASPSICDVLAYKYRYGETYLDQSNDISWINATGAMIDGFFMMAGMRQEAEAALKIMKKSKLYLYSFNYFSQSYKWAKLWKGVLHCCEMPFMFASEEYGVDRGSFEQGTKFDKNDLVVVDLMGKWWTNFAKTGNPNLPSVNASQWSEVSSRDGLMQYYAINSVSSTMTNYHYDSFNLWNMIQQLNIKINALQQTGSSAGPEITVDIFFWFLAFILSIFSMN